MTPKFIVASDSPKRTGSRYPAPYNEPCMARSKAILGDQFGLTQFGVNLVTLPPGTWASQRHWHEKEDEFIVVMEGELVLADDSGEHVLTPGMCAGFKANTGNGHCLKNLTDKPAIYLEVGSRIPGEKAVYSDVDMKGENVDGSFTFTRKDGSRF
jgi:uncharacterized cupin superfamily protein